MSAHSKWNQASQASHSIISSSESGLPQWQYTEMTKFESLFLLTCCFLKLGNGESTFFFKHCTRWLRILAWSKTTSSMSLLAAMWIAVAIVKMLTSQEPLSCCMGIDDTRRPLFPLDIVDP